ncbi:RNA polymerase sigma factor [Actinomadura verrucosospora]|uniref:ECF subfamily RNA polymerase sigma-24 subunit n=1 Tax=Actinomadura verrucosospora TaxID=46165 RepID=A0A7D3ZJH0_ACTVE|nr:sigma-70 family RNA polymerase sigma factor [Actinomadura verrucosospora]QKG19823.1 ECF subfamily RNA polymerase sigma-24 subunit [Actinomadura verrucosospora]
MSRTPAADPLRGDAVVSEAPWYEPEQFAEIFHRHFPDVHRYVAGRLGADAADDIAAETFLTAYRRRDRYDPARGALRPWLFGIATNLVGMHRRGEARYLRTLAKAPVSGPQSGPEERVLAQVSAGVVRGRLAEAIRALPPGDRDVLLLVALGDCTYPEVAEALGLKPGTVASRLNRARRKLRDALGGADPTLITEESER